MLISFISPKSSLRIVIISSKLRISVSFLVSTSSFRAWYLSRTGFSIKVSMYPKSQLLSKQMILCKLSKNPCQSLWKLTPAVETESDFCLKVLFYSLGWTLRKRDGKVYFRYITQSTMLKHHLRVNKSV